MLAIIGGSGLTRIAGFDVAQSKTVDTPYGAPSSALTFGSIGGRELLFLARHGDPHAISPHRINYRANLWALREEGVEGVVAVATVGGIGAEFPPGALAVPDQIIDYTWGRASTFFEDDGKPVTHVDFTEPYSSGLRERILRAAAACGEPVHDGATYAATQGPRLESAAEVLRLARDGADLVGMTGMPEAGLARELGLQYAAIAVVVNHAAGQGDSAREISHQQMARVLDSSMARVCRVIERLVAG